MTKIIKRLVIVLVVLLLAGTLSVSAETVSLKLPDGFYDYSKEPSKTAEILSMTETELSEYCAQKNVVLLAVDEENARQIRVTVGETGFSNSLVNLSELTDDKIKSLAPEISGFDGVKGEVVSLGAQKFLKVNLHTQDDGGEYYLTQYITVAQRQNIILSFYTDTAVSTDYISDVFESFSSKMFLGDEEQDDKNDEQKTVNLLLVVVPIVLFGFLAASIGIVVSLIIDVKKNGNFSDDDFEDDEEIQDSAENEKKDNQ